jgi:Rrf2 family protein
MRAETGGDALIRLSNLTQAAIEALPALLDAQAPLRHWQIAQDYQLAPPLVREACARLTKAGILKAKRGRDGGYALQRDPASVTLLEVIAAVEGAPFPEESQGELLARVNQLLGTAVGIAGQCTLADLRRANTGESGSV